MTVSVRVMSYNIEGHAVAKRRKHIAQIAEVIRQMRPDVVGLQEVHRKTTRGGGSDQLEELAAATGLVPYFGPSLSAWGGEFGNAVLASGTVLDGKVHPLPGPGESRSVLECRVALRGGTVTFVVTHLAAWFRFQRLTRSAQLDRLGEIVRRTARPFLLVGDFNTPPSAPEMASLLASEHLRICGEHLEPSHRFSRTRLDYVFGDPDWVVRDAWVIRLGPSDHWPLIVDLEREAAAE